MGRRGASRRSSFARNDGNLTHMEVLLGMGPIQGVVTVLVNDIEIPLARDGHGHDGDGLVQRGQHRDAERARSTWISRMGRGIRWAIRTAAWRI